MSVFKYCPILGLRYWKFPTPMADALRTDLKQFHPSIKDRNVIKSSRQFKTQHKENGRITKPIRGEDE
jgi:hypothetical protein